MHRQPAHFAEVNLIKEVPNVSPTGDCVSRSHSIIISASLDYTLIIWTMIVSPHHKHGFFVNMVPLSLVKTIISVLIRLSVANFYVKNVQVIICVV